MIKKVSSFQLVVGIAIIVGGALIPVVDVYLDCRLDMSANTSMIIRSCYFQLHHISQINKFLPRKTRERVVNVLITSRLDYCNSLLFGTMDYSVVRVPKYASVTPVLRDLHWQPPYECMLISRSWHWSTERSTTVGPMYLCNIVSLHKSTRSIRSAEKHLLVRPRTRCKVGDASFVVAAPDLCNDLPVSLL